MSIRTPEEFFAVQFQRGPVAICIEDSSLYKLEKQGYSIKPLLDFLDDLVESLSNGASAKRRLFSGFPKGSSGDFRLRIAEKHGCKVVVCERSKNGDGYRQEEIKFLGALAEKKYLVFIGTLGHTCKEFKPALENLLKSGVTLFYVTHSRILDKELQEEDPAVLDVLELLNRYSGVKVLIDKDLQLFS